MSQVDSVRELAVSPSGHKVYVSNAAKDFSIITTATGAIQTVALARQFMRSPSAVVVSPDGSKVFVGNGFRPAPGTAQPGTVEIFDTATRAFAGFAPVESALDGVLDPAANEAYFVRSLGFFSLGYVYVLNITTNQIARTQQVGGTSVLDGTIAVGNPAGCAFRLAPTIGHFGSAVGSGTIDVRAPAGCAWNLTTAASWITFTSSTTGSGHGVLLGRAGRSGGAVRERDRERAGRPHAER